MESLEELLSQGKDPTRFIEDLIFFYRDMLLYKAAPNLDESLERVMLDEDFQSLATSISPDEIYQLIHLLNKTQQEMRWTNHPKIFLEVAIVKLCQLERSSATGAQPEEWNELKQKVVQLENEINHLKQHGVAVTDESQPHIQKKPQRTTRKGFQAPAGKINEILKQATKQDLSAIKSRWGEIIDQLNAHQMRSQAALLKEAEPVAASDQAFVIKFKYEIHCQMAMNNDKFIDTISTIVYNLIGKRIEAIGVPEDQWIQIRESFVKTQHNDHPESSQFGEAEEDSLISEAKKLFGEELIEIKE